METNDVTAASAGESSVKESPREVSVGRRQALTKAFGVATLGAAGVGALSILDAGPAAASNGDSVLAGGTVTASATTTLASSNGSATGLWVTDGASSGLGYTAAVIGDSDAQNGVAGLTTTDGVGVYGVSHARSGLGYAPAAVFGDSDTHAGVYGESANDNGVYGRSVSSSGVAGESPGIGVYGGATGSQYGIGVYGYAPGTQAAGVLGNAPQGIGLQGGGLTGVYAAGDGSSAQAVVAVTASNKAAVQSTNSGSGAAVAGKSKNGRGGTFQGGAAALQLVAGTHSTHPKSGSRGDLYVDTTGRLWFCKKSGATALWHQIA